MRKLHVLAAGSAALALTAVAGGASAQAAPNLFAQTANSAVYYPANPPALEATQFFWGGHNYCWYDGWHGPGWYWCGYGFRSGYGWGGGYGFHGWSHGGGHGGFHGGGGGFHGGGGGFHGGGGGFHGGGGGFHGGGGGFHGGGGGGHAGGGGHGGGGHGGGGHGGGGGHHH